MQLVPCSIEQRVRSSIFKSTIIRIVKHRPNHIISHSGLLPYYIEEKHLCSPLESYMYSFQFTCLKLEEVCLFFCLLVMASISFRLPFLESQCCYLCWSGGYCQNGGRRSRSTFSVHNRLGQFTYFRCILQTPYQ